MPGRVLRWFAAPLLLAYAAIAATAVRMMFPGSDAFFQQLLLSAGALIILTGVALAADVLTQRNRRWDRLLAGLVALIAMGLAVYCGLLAALLAVSIAPPPV